MLNVSRGGYYAWKKRVPSQRERDDSTLAAKITSIFLVHKKRYGVRRIHAELLRSGIRVAYKRVARLMRQLGLRSVHPTPRKRTTTPATHRIYAPDLVQRNFVPNKPNTLWYGDITYARTMEGWTYIASVIDGYSKKIVGWSIADRMDTNLVINALNKAIQQRKPPKNVIFHSDRGSQYTSTQFITHCRKNNIRNSTGRTGSCYDNAAAESFWATLKKELIHQQLFITQQQLTHHIFEYIEGYYNKHRIHSALNYKTPHEHEQHYKQQQAA